MNARERLSHLYNQLIKPFADTNFTEGANPWAVRSVFQLEYAWNLSPDADRPDPAVIKAVDQVWSAWRQEGTITASACAAMEQTLAPLAEQAKALRLICVGHAHIDMNWMWSYDETCAVTLDTFRTMLELMDEDPDFTFAQSQASVYRIVEKLAPEMLDPIKKRIREGRWEVIASTWVEADRNMPSAESMARHFLYTRRYLGELLELPDSAFDLDFEPDTFGHHHHVPEVLSAAGIRYYYHCRGDNRHELYNWRAPSGRKILVLREPSWYNAAVDGRSALPAPAFCRRHKLDALLRVYGVGDHGGGPTRRDIANIRLMDTWPIFPRFTFGTYRDFYRLAEEQRAKYPEIDGELNVIFDGCYTTQTRQKSGNRRSERILGEAESLAALLGSVGGPPAPTRPFADAWEKVLFNQFHDILPGSGVIATREHAMAMYQEAWALAGAERNRAIRQLAAMTGTSGLFGGPADPDTVRVGADGATAYDAADVSFGAGAGYAADRGLLSKTSRQGGIRRLFGVYSMLPFERRELVSLIIWDWPGDPQRMTFRDASGEPLAHQPLRSGVNAYWGHRFAEVLVQVTVPAGGYASILLDQAAEVTAPTPPPDDLRVARAEPLVLENEFLRAELDGSAGTLISLLDKKTGRDFASADQPIGLFRMIEEDPARGMTAWTIGRHGATRSLHDEARIRSYQNGDGCVRSSVTVFIPFGNGSSLKYVVSLDPGQARLDYALDIQWQEIGKADTFLPQLSFLLPLSYPNARFRYDTPMGVIDRPARDINVPAQSLAVALADDGGSGLALFNDSTYGYRADRNGLSLTVIRSSIDPDPWPEVGRHLIRMAIAVVAPDEQTAAGAARLIRHAQAFCCPLDGSSIVPADGPLPATASFFTCDTDALVIQAIKPAENGDGLIVRCADLAGRDGDGRISFYARPVKAGFVDIHEVDQSVPGVQIDGNSVVFPYSAYGLSSLRVTCARQDVPAELQDVPSGRQDVPAELQDVPSGPQDVPAEL